MKKQVFALILCGAMCITLFDTPVFAVNQQTVKYDARRGFDTLDFTQEDYLPLTNNARQADEAQLEQVIIGFLASTKAYVRAPESYDNKTGFISRAAIDTETVQYRLSEAEYKMALNEAMGWEITSDNLSFSDFVASVNGETATASIVEDYTYYITDGFDSESFRRREYTFDLEKDENGWEIVGVITNDPWELKDSFDYTPIDVNSNISRAMAAEEQASLMTTAAMDEATDEAAVAAADAVAAAASLNTWTYSTSNAVTYAKNHYSDRSNSVFGVSSSNCQNFASQCVWAGLGGSGTSTSARPAVSTSIAGTDGPNVWWRNHDTKCYTSTGYTNLNWTWDNVDGFANMMAVSQPSLEGPYGNTQYSGYFGYAAVGNVLEIDFEGAPDRDSIDHAMFVTEVSGTSGSRTTAQVKVAAHTSYTNSAYETVENYMGLPASYFARVVINRGYYATTQP